MTTPTPNPTTSVPLTKTKKIILGICAATIIGLTVAITMNEDSDIAKTLTAALVSVLQITTGTFNGQ